MVFMVGCSSVPTRVDKGPVRASTYSVMSSKAETRGVIDERREEVHRIIQSAIADELGRKGLTQVASGGDVKVGYLVIVVDNVSTTTDSDYFGFGRDASALAKKAHKARSTNKNRDYFEIGAVVIDVVDPRDSKVLFRSTARMDVRNVTPASSGERINRLVAACLEGLRIDE
jgi:hypothetical protein